jgi:hypothetical protein
MPLRTNPEGKAPKRGSSKGAEATGTSGCPTHGGRNHVRAEYRFKKPWRARRMVYMSGEGIAPGTGSAGG